MTHDASRQAPLLVVTSHGLTDAGRCRQRNEDCLLLDDGLGLYVVADGMGGHKGGDVAARLTVRVMHTHLMRARAAGVTGAVGERQHLPGAADLSPAARDVHAAIQAANLAVKTAAQESPDLEGMGSTVAAVYLHKQVLVAANVGDSPIYLLRGGVLRLLSVPHTVAAEQGGRVKTLPAPLQEQFSHMLTRAVGTREAVEADFFETIPRTGDVLLLCTDGLTGKVADAELQAMLEAHPPREACGALVRLALERGGEDNITCLVLQLQAA